MIDTVTAEALAQLMDTEPDAEFLAAVVILRDPHTTELVGRIGGVSGMGKTEVIVCLRNIADRMEQALIEGAELND